MEAVICSASALEYWRKRSDALGSFSTMPAAVPARRSCVKVDLPSSELISYLNTLGYSSEGQVDLLLGSHDERRKLKGVRYRSISHELPSRSFVRDRGQVYVVTPELLFVMAAARLSFPRLLELGHELCGTYRVTKPQVTYGVQPLTSVSALRLYVQKVEWVQGKSAALKACQWIANGSASPAETALSVAFRLPYRYGGYGLGTPLLNQEIPLNETAIRLLGGQQQIKPDFLWTKRKHPAEYDSSLYHSEREQIEVDERRRNAYAAMGLSVTVIRPRHLCNRQLLDQIAIVIRKNAGIRLGRLPDDYEERHQALYQEVFRYWIELKESHPSKEDYLLGAAQYSEPHMPW